MPKLEAREAVQQLGWSQMLVKDSGSRNVKKMDFEEDLVLEN